MTIETERLLLRDLKSTDVESLVRNLNDLNVSGNLLVVPHPYTEKDAIDFVAHCAGNARKDPRTAYNFGIESKIDGKLIGGIGLNHLDWDERTAHIGYYLGTEFQRKGFMSEAAGALIKYAFNELDLKELEAPIFVGNEASQALARSLGFELAERREKEATSKATGETHDIAVYVLKR
tara:strand:+ start:6404 stop:6937 length:534 start_codon:yes stop_codon:yes gene_type:complete